MTGAVLVTRAPARCRELTRALRERGYRVLCAPIFDEVLPADPAPLRAALEELLEARAPAWLAVTSASTVTALARILSPTAEPRALAAVERARRGGRGLRVASVGPATTRALAEAGVGVDFQPVSEHSAAGMLDQWPAGDPPGTTVHLPVSAIASDTLERGLAERGYRVRRVTAYESAPHPAAQPLRPVHADAADPPVLALDDAAARLRAGTLAAVVATAPSRARALLTATDAAPGTDPASHTDPTSPTIPTSRTDPVPHTAPASHTDPTTDGGAGDQPGRRVGRGTGASGVVDPSREAGRHRSPVWVAIGQPTREEISRAGRHAVRSAGTDARALAAAVSAALTGGPEPDRVRDDVHDTLGTGEL